MSPGKTHEDQKILDLFSPRFTSYTVFLKFWLKKLCPVVFAIVRDRTLIRIAALPGLAGLKGENLFQVTSRGHTL
ncbi:hypothetical protein CVT26_005225 [Gymnopilus dilepis]|uniref:Uncharacterized protein n=1 Tax=Gymnopilus dilepis TaxID=231916 RepID=A0A409W8L9_9AGAR|nr:hypothetical protein CVT26_005225 [Gymnopilus dilepis]